MTRLVAVTLLLGGSALGLTACSNQGQAPYGPGSANSAPYSDVSNPFCGALGNCQPYRTRPYDMHGNPSGGM